jgi:hypothetical protein
MVRATHTDDVFLSYNSRDDELVNRVAVHLRSSGLSVFLDRWYLVPGESWLQRLEAVLHGCRAAAIFIGPHGLGEWQRREQYLALDRQAHDSSFRVIPVLLPGADPPLGFLSLNSWVDLRDGVEGGQLAAVSEAIRHGRDSTRVAETITICPYRGLKFFREEDSAFFFGRDAFVTRLETVIHRQEVVAVVGASGSGKSSVVRAGLVPRLRQVKGGTVWGINTMVPGDRPMQNLAGIVVDLLEPELAEIERLQRIGDVATSLAQKRFALRDAVSRALEKQAGTDRLMVIVDQWEELYTLTRDASNSARFIDLLLEGTALAPLSVLFTLRGDFFDHVLQNRALSDRIQDAVVNISDMTRTELHEAIERPAERVGLRFAEGLSHRILDTVNGQPGNLPLLEFVLSELWSQRNGQTLTHSAYEKIGQVQGAIATRAESLYASLSEHDQQSARRVFLQLIRPGREEAPFAEQRHREPMRGRVPWTEMHDLDVSVVRRLTDAHLLVSGRNDATGTEYVEIVHEALINGWDRLRGWVDEDIEFLAWRERLRALMAIAAAGNHEDHLFLRGTLLLEARQWLRQRSPDLSTAELSFIKTSIKKNRHRIAQVCAITTVVLVLALIANHLFSFRSRSQPLSGTPPNPAPHTASPGAASATRGPSDTDATDTELPSPTLFLRFLPNDLSIVPLRVWIPRTTGEVPTSTLTTELAKQAERRELFWEDPQEPNFTDTYLLRRGQVDWELLTNGSVLTRTKSDRDVVRLLSRIPKLSSLFVQFPASPELAHEIEASAPQWVEWTRQPDQANYVLVGRYSEGSLAFAWMRTLNQPLFLPTRTAWQQDEKPDDPAAGHATAELLSHSISQLGRLHAWSVLQTPPGSQFFYHLRIHPERTRESSKRLVDGEIYHLVLLASQQPAAEHVDPRYVYVFVIDSDGKSTLLFPTSERVENRFPLPIVHPGDDVPMEIPLEGAFRASPPYGFDMFYLLATEEPLPNPRVLDWESVRAETVKTAAKVLPASPETRTTASSVKSKSVPQVKWSIERLVIEAVRR